MDEYYLCLFEDPFNTHINLILPTETIIPSMEKIKREKRFWYIMLCDFQRKIIWNVKKKMQIMLNKKINELYIHIQKWNKIPK